MGAQKSGPGSGAHATRNEGEKEPLTCGLFRDGSAKLQRPIFLSTACDKCDDGAEHRHDCDLLAHGFTPDVASLRSTLAMLRWASQHLI